MQTFGENVVLIYEEGKIVGFIDRDARVHKSEPMKTDDVAKLIDPDYGVVARTMRKNGEKGKKCEKCYGTGRYGANGEEVCPDCKGNGTA
jgi:DnaJ-class molecular chaperone